MLRISTLIALLMAFVLVNGVSFQAGATTPDTILKSDEAGISEVGSSQIGSGQVDRSQVDSGQVDGTGRIRLAAPKLDPNATVKPTNLSCSSRQCKNHRVNRCTVTHHGTRHCNCRATAQRC